MVNFEDGTLVKVAYVEINGVEYPVHMPEYSGTTPITAENLNKMQGDIQENIEKGAKIATISATISANVTLATAGTRYRLNLNTIQNNNSEFSLSEDGGIVCPYSGTISVTASAMASPKKGYVGLSIYKNSNLVCDYYEPAGTQTYGCIETANRIVEISAGDILYLYAQSNIEDDIVQASARTRMTIMYVDFT